jgi:hypothetical protein
MVRPTTVSIPGAPAGASKTDAAGANDRDQGANAGTGADSKGQANGESQADKDAEIAALRAQLAAAQAKNAPQGEALIFEADGPNTRKYKAESKHLGYTSAELDKLVRSGKVKLTDHHVLCKDGWYVNPQAQQQANG